MTYKVLIDGDVLVYRAVARMEPVYYYVGSSYYKLKAEAIAASDEAGLDRDDIFKLQCMEAPFRLEYVVNQVVEETEAKVYKALKGKEHDIVWVFSGSNNFRKELDPEYKAQRPPKPFYAEHALNCLMKQTGGVSFENIETDDAITLMAEQDLSNSIMVSVDKDLLNIPCWHINLDTKLLKKVTPEQGLSSFLKQCVQGDSVDNIKGIKGLGPVGARDIVDSLKEKTWEDFLVTLEATCNENNKVFNKERVTKDAILLDVGAYYARQLGFELPDSIRELFKQRYKEIKKFMKRRNLL